MSHPFRPATVRQRAAPLQRPLALLAACFMAGAVAQTHSGSGAARGSGQEPGVVQKVGGAVERGVKAAASGVDRGVKAAASGAKKAGDAVERGAKAAGSAVSGGARKIGVPNGPASAPSRQAP